MLSLNDMTLFGVGVAAGNVSGTTLGRIRCWIRVYADWYPQITWTTPGLGPIGAKIGVMQATPVQSSTGADATNTTTPRVEAQLDYSFEVGGLGGYIWVDGQYQNLGKNYSRSFSFQLELDVVLKMLPVLMKLKQLVSCRRHRCCWYRIWY